MNACAQLEDARSSVSYLSIYSILVKLLFYLDMIAGGKHDVSHSEYSLIKKKKKKISCQYFLGSEIERRGYITLGASAVAWQKS